MSCLDRVCQWWWSPKSQALGWDLKMNSKVWRRPEVEIKMRCSQQVTILMFKIIITLLNNKSKRIPNSHKIESIRQMKLGAMDCLGWENFEKIIHQWCCHSMNKIKIELFHKIDSHYYCSKNLFKLIKYKIMALAIWSLQKMKINRIIIKFLEIKFSLKQILRLLLLMEHKITIFNTKSY